MHVEEDRKSEETKHKSSRKDCQKPKTGHRPTTGQTGLIILAIAVSIIAIAFFTQQNSWFNAAPTPLPSSKTIIDMAGVSVTLPSNVQRVGAGRPVFCEILLALGAQDKIVATSPLDTYYWLKKVYPGISNLSCPFALSGVNTEELLRSKPDVVFLLTGDKAVESVEALGIPVIQLSTKNEAEIKQTIAIIGDSLGESYSKIAEQYNAYYGEKADMIRSISAEIPQDQWPSVLVMYGLSPALNVYGNNTAMAGYISWAGGRNAASEMNTAGQVSMEQLLKWDPDIIIVSVDPSALDGMKSDLSWNQLKAVKNGEVHINPKGVWTWDAKSAEMPLEILWIAKTLHPDFYRSINMPSEIKYFYSTFFNYDLTDEDVNRILSAQPPA